MTKIRGLICLVLAMFAFGVAGAEPIHEDETLSLTDCLQESGSTEEYLAATGPVASADKVASARAIQAAVKLSKLLIYCVEHPKTTRGNPDKLERDKEIYFRLTAGRLLELAAHHSVLDSPGRLEFRRQAMGIYVETVNSFAKVVNEGTRSASLLSSARTFQNSLGLMLDVVGRYDTHSAAILAEQSVLRSETEALRTTVLSLRSEVDSLKSAAAATQKEPRVLGVWDEKVPQKEKDGRNRVDANGKVVMVDTCAWVDAEKAKPSGHHFQCPKGWVSTGSYYNLKHRDAKSQFQTRCCPLKFK